MAGGGIAASSITAHGDSLARRIGRGLALPFRPTEDTLASVEVGEGLQRPITTGRRIVVTRPRVGAGRSAVTALLASVFAHYRNDRVLAMDITPGSEALALRLGVRPESSLAGIDECELDFGSFEDVERHLAPVRNRLWMLPALTGEGSGAIAAESFHRTLLPITRFFGVTLIDRVADAFDGFNYAAQAGAHAHVLVVPATREGALDIARALDWMMANGAETLPAKIVVVFVEQVRAEQPGFDAAGAAEVLRGSGAEVVRLGYDRHLAVAPALDPRRISGSTHAAATRIALLALHRAG